LKLIENKFSAVLRAKIQPKFVAGQTHADKLIKQAGDEHFFKLRLAMCCAIRMVHSESSNWFILMSEMDK
jgi:hypothetical protein